ncbi:PKD domain-containing protein [Helicobacter muridarum]|uniref:PKD domain-containing protein n=1 Tax=Helicobacter muridarum TaxID=216 RepID=A0A099U1V6_9HELI|nr:PKD domain-containing protein [Helicobacter muridarum]STQ85762.1 Uncharacterised protein [Helicobacter muridarum]
MDKDIKNLTLKKFKENFDFIESTMQNSKMYTEAFKSFQEGMKDYAFSDDQKAQALATFISQVFQSGFQIAVQTALSIDLNEIQTRDAQNKSALEILGIQKDVTSKANAAKESFYRVQASKMQAAQLQAQALQDKIKAEVLHKSSNDNAQINKANCMVSYQNVMGNVNKPQLITQYQMQKETVNALKAIGEARINDYTKELDKVKIPEFSEEQDTNVIEIYATKQIVSIEEPISFIVISSIELESVVWNFGDNNYGLGYNVIYAYKQSGEYKVNMNATLSLKDNESKQYQRSLDIIVK